MAIDLNKIPSPCYVIEEKLLRQNLEKISQVKKDAGVDIILALKGFSSWGVFPIVKEYLNAATASSVNEARLAFEELGGDVHTYAPAYNPKNFDEIIKYSTHITFNSLSQYQNFYPRIQESGKKISVGLRVNPAYSCVVTDLYNPCAPGSRLGITEDHLKDGLPEGVEGLHFHNLCESGPEELVKTLDSFIQRYERFLPQLKWVNMGGGHLITRKEYNTQLLVDTLTNFKEKYGVKITMEPGAAFAWQTGYLVASVLDIIENNGIRTAILDVSFTAHMPDCLEMPYKPNILGAHSVEGAEGAFRLGGNSCLSGDYMGYWKFKNDLKIGDKIAFDDMIHYTMVKTSTFNGVEHPSIGIWTKKDKFKLIKQFTYEEFKNKLS